MLPSLQPFRNHAIEDNSYLTSSPFPPHEAIELLPSASSTGATFNASKGFLSDSVFPNERMGDSFMPNTHCTFLSAYRMPNNPALTDEVGFKLALYSGNQVGVSDRPLARFQPRDSTDRSSGINRRRFQNAF